MLLSDLKCRTAKPQDKPYKLTDGRGLYLVVQPNGSKLWHFDYNYGEKRYMLGDNKLTGSRCNILF